MSYTLKKLKQSEIDRGYRKPPVNKQAKPSYGVFIACFAIVLALSLVLVKERKNIFSQQLLTSPNPVITPPNDTLANMASKNLVNEHIPDNSEIREKNIPNKKKIDKAINLAKTDEKISPNHATSKDSWVPSIISEPYLFNLLAEDKFVENSTPMQLLENNSIEKSKQDINLSTFVNEQTSIKGKNTPEENNTPADNQLVLWQELPPDFRKNLPEMDLNGVAYLNKVEDRYVFINMNKYQVDDLVDKGPSVEEIKQNSVIMFYKNRRFILSLSE